MKFNTIGIICEYNPFHFGHKYHIQKTKEIYGCENVVCIMSGSMVQRGECAIFDKWQRAKSAIDAGADLVIELPAYYVLQSADIFALGAVEILDKCGIIDALSFGCECGNIDALIRAASVMSGEKYNLYVKKFLDTGMGYPKACEKALIECMPEFSCGILKPNNTLGICYIKALNSLNSKITPVCIKRDNDYHGEQTNDGYLSASQIRKMITENSDYSEYANDYSKENIYNLKNAETYILGVLRNTPLQKFREIKGYEDGLGELVFNSSKKACTIDELFEMCSGKRYTIHRIKRYIMCVILNVSYNANPEYLRVLGIGKKGSKLLKEIKFKSDINIITKLADYKNTDPMLKTDIAATDFASLCAADIKLRHSGKDYTTSPYIEKPSR